MTDLGFRGYLVAVSAVFALVWAIGAALGPYAVGDSEQYVRQAVNLEAGRPPYAQDWTAARDSIQYSLRPPGYASALVAVRTVSRDVRWLAALQSLLGAATWGMVWLALSAVGGVRRVGPLMVGLVATPATLIYAQTAMADTLFTALLMAALWRWAVFVADGRGREIVTAHALLAVALWVKPVVLYIWPGTLALALWALWRRGRRGAGLLPSASAGLVPLAALALMAVNAQWTGHAEVSSIQTLNLVEVNAQRTLARTGEQGVYDQAAAQAAQIPVYADRQRWRAAWAVQAIGDRAGTYAALHMTGVAAFFLDPGRFDLALFFGLDSPGGAMRAASRAGPAGALAVWSRQSPALKVALGVLLILNIAVILGFGAWVLWGAVPVELRLAALGIVIYVAMVTGPVGAARYRLAVAPILALALPWAFSALRHRFSHASRSRAV